MLNRVKKLAQRWNTRGKCRAIRLVLTDQGFDVFERGRAEPVASVRWADVRSIRAYKLDLLTYDCICLAFQVGEDKWLEIIEEDEGFPAVQQKMEETFPGIPPTWLTDVAFPAFETHETVLYPQYEKLYVEQEEPVTSSPTCPWVYWLSRADVASAVCGLFAFALLSGTGHPILVVAAILAAVLTILGAAAIRRHYGVQDPPATLVKVMLDNPPADREVVMEVLHAKAYKRVVPRWVRVPFALFRLCNVVLLIVGLVVCVHAARSG